MSTFINRRELVVKSIRIKKDAIKDGITSNEQLKIPRKRLESVQSGGGSVIGNIIYDQYRKTFYGNTGSKWVPFHGNYAPANATYITVSPSADLPNERVLTAGENISIADGGANGAITLSTPSITLSNAGTPGYSIVNDGSGPELAVKAINPGSGIVINTSATDITIGLGGAPPVVDAQFVTMALNGGLSQERVLTAGTNISIVDGGANGPVTIDTTYKRTVVTLSPYSVLQSDDIIAVYPLSVTIQINLPQISGLTTPNKYKRYSIVDEGGNSGNNAIYVVAFTGNTIIGDTSVAINQNYNSINVYTDGVGSWFLN